MLLGQHPRNDRGLAMRTRGKQDGGSGKLHGAALAARIDPAKTAKSTYGAFYRGLRRQLGPCLRRGDGESSGGLSPLRRQGPR